jgi:hypothetical protein
LKSQKLDLQRPLRRVNRNLMMGNSKLNLTELQSGKIYSGDGFVLQREKSLGDFWVLRSAATGGFIDRDRHRSDLAERNNIKLINVH